MYSCDTLMHDNISRLPCIKNDRKPKNRQSIKCMSIYTLIHVKCDRKPKYPQSIKCMSIYTDTCKMCIYTQQKKV